MIISKTINKLERIFRVTIVIELMVMRMVCLILYKTVSKAYDKCNELTIEAINISNISLFTYIISGTILGATGLYLI